MALRYVNQSHGHFDCEFFALVNHSVASILVQVKYGCIPAIILECVLSCQIDTSYVHGSRLSELVKALCCFAETESNAGGNLKQRAICWVTAESV